MIESSGDDGDYTRKVKSNRSAFLEDPPDPPKTVAEIFECAGTPVLILNHQSEKMITSSSRTSDGVRKQHDVIDRPTSITRMASRIDFDPGLSIEECKEMALSACQRLLERYLDTHHIELQEALFSSADGTTGFDESQVMIEPGNLTLPSLHSVPENTTSATASARLIPTKVLDSILETATLFSMTFPSENAGTSDQLSQFVSSAFSSFLQHVRSELLELVMQMTPKDWKHEISGKTDPISEHANDDTETGEEGLDEHQDSDEKAYEHITNATTRLLESVRQLASGLALPEVAIDLDLASSLVEQAVGLSEAMVRRRVDQKFYSLRFRVIEEILAPFCRKALQERSSSDDEETKEDNVQKVIQMGSVALSDSLQLVDDTVRSILSNVKSETLQASTSSFGSSEDSSMLKIAVEQSTSRFAIWLAAAMETIAGCESSEPSYIVDVKPDSSSDANYEDLSFYNITDPLSRETSGDDDIDLRELVESCMTELLDELDNLGTGSSKADLTLAIVEMCRVAQGSVVDDIAASIATHTGIINKQKSSKAGLFATTPGGGSSDPSNPMSERFRLAASRVLNLYSINRGYEGGELLCTDLLDLSKEDYNQESTGPRTSAWSLLTVVKNVCYDCSEIFGGSKREGPVPENLEDEYASLTMSRQLRTSGLAFDVERMFAEKVIVYPSPFEIVDFERNSVVSLVLKVALKALAEDTKMVRFSIQGYRQLLVDVEFLKFMIPHYVKDDVLRNILTETIKCAKERCDSSAMLQDDTDEINQARASVRDFMSTNNSGQDGLLNRFTIPDED